MYAKKHVISDAERDAVHSLCAAKPYRLERALTAYCIFRNNGRPHDRALDMVNNYVVSGSYILQPEAASMSAHEGMHVIVDDSDNAALANTIEISNDCAPLTAPHIQIPPQVQIAAQPIDTVAIAVNGTSVSAKTNGHHSNRSHRNGAEMAAKNSVNGGQMRAKRQTVETIQDKLLLLATLPQEVIEAIPSPSDRLVPHTLRHMQEQGVDVSLGNLASRLHRKQIDMGKQVERLVQTLRDASTVFAVQPEKKSAREAAEAQPATEAVHVNGNASITSVATTKPREARTQSSDWTKLVRQIPSEKLRTIHLSPLQSRIVGVYCRDDYQGVISARDLASAVDSTPGSVDVAKVSLHKKLHGLIEHAAQAKPKDLEEKPTDTPPLPVLATPGATEIVHAQAQVASASVKTVKQGAHVVLPLAQLGNLTVSEAENSLLASQRQFLSTCRKLFQENNGKLTPQMVVDAMGISFSNFYQLKRTTERGLGLRVKNAQKDDIDAASANSASESSINSAIAQAKPADAQNALQLTVSTEIAAADTASAQAQVDSASVKTVKQGAHVVLPLAQLGNLAVSEADNALTPGQRLFLNTCRKLSQENNGKLTSQMVLDAMGISLGSFYQMKRMTERGLGLRAENAKKADIDVAGGDSDSEASTSSAIAQCNPADAQNAAPLTVAAADIVNAQSQVVSASVKSVKRSAHVVLPLAQLGNLAASEAENTLTPTQRQFLSTCRKLSQENNGKLTPQMIVDSMGVSFSNFYQLKQTIELKLGLRAKNGQALAPSTSGTDSAITVTTSPTAQAEQADPENDLPEAQGIHVDYQVEWPGSTKHNGHHAPDSASKATSNDEPKFDLSGLSSVDGTTAELASALTAASNGSNGLASYASRVVRKAYIAEEDGVDDADVADEPMAELSSYNIYEVPKHKYNEAYKNPGKYIKDACDSDELLAKTVATYKEGGADMDAGRKSKLEAFMLQRLNKHFPLGIACIIISEIQRNMLGLDVAPNSRKKQIGYLNDSSLAAPSSTPGTWVRRIAHESSMEALNIIRVAPLANMPQLESTEMFVSNNKNAPRPDELLSQLRNADSLLDSAVTEYANVYGSMDSEGRKSVERGFNDRLTHLVNPMDSLSVVMEIRRLARTKSNDAQLAL